MSKAGNKDEALKAFNKALEMSPSDWEIMNNIGSILFERGQYEGAAEHYLKALQIKNDDVELLSNLGNTLTKLKDYQNAWAAFEEALKLNPASVPVIENYFLCLLEAKQFDKFEELIAKFTFLPADVKTRILTLCDEYKVTLGIKPKKALPKKNSSNLHPTPSKQRNSLKGETPIKKAVTHVYGHSPDGKEGDYSGAGRSSIIHKKNTLQEVEEENEDNFAHYTRSAAKKDGGE